MADKKAVLLIAFMLLGLMSSIKIMPLNASTTANLGATDDTYISAFFDTYIYGAEQKLLMQGAGTYQWIILIRFDVETYQACDPASVILKLWCYDNASGKTYRVRVITESWDEDTTKWTNQPSVSTNYLDFASPSSTGWWNITITDLWDTAGIIYGFRIEDYNVAAGVSWFSSSENATTSHRPILSITYTAAATYTFSAPKFENATVINELNVTAHFETVEDKVFTTTNGGSYIFSAVPMFFSWEVETDHRIFYPKEPSITINLYVPEEDHYAYVFTVRDYAGIVDETAFLECYRIVGTTKYLVERDYVLGAINGVAIPMHYGGSYELVLNTSEIEYIFGWFLASSTLENTLTVKSIDFPTNIKLTYIYITCYSYRSEDMETITSDYVNNVGDTVSVDIYIVYTNGTIANSTSSGSDNVHWVWNTANNLTDYIVYFDANSTSLGIITYRQVLPHFIDVVSPFNLSYLGFTGLADKIIPIVIILFVAIAFSTITVPLGIFMIVVTAATERYLGWYAITPYGLTADLELLTIIGSLAVLYGIYVASKRER